MKHDGKWQAAKQEYVKPEDEVRFGGFYTITVSELLKKAGVANPLLLTKA